VLLVGMKLAAVLVPVVVVFWLPKSGLILVPAMAAEALMSALTMTPLLIAVTPLLLTVTSPLKAVAVGTLEALPINTEPAVILASLV